MHENFWKTRRKEKLGKFRRKCEGNINIDLM